jgi:hypothetical protein
MKERRLVRDAPRFFLRLALLALPLLLAGCGIGPDWPAIAQQAANLRASCEHELASGIVKTHLAVERCANPPIRNLYVQAGWPDIDVLDAYLAKREAIASQWDRGAITPLQARADLAQALVDQNTELQRRYAARSTALRAPTPMICTRMGPNLYCR